MVFKEPANDVFRRETTEKGGATAGEVAVTAGNVVAADVDCFPGDETGAGLVHPEEYAAASTMTQHRKRKRFTREFYETGVLFLWLLFLKYLAGNGTRKS
jgi:hypothetical protein